MVFFVPILGLKSDLDTIFAGKCCCFLHIFISVTKNDGTVQFCVDYIVITQRRSTKNDQNASGK